MRTYKVFVAHLNFLPRAVRFIPIKFMYTNQDKLLILSVALCAIGFSFIEAYDRHVCQHNVKVPYNRKVNKTELIPFEENTYNYGKKIRYREVTSVVEEVAYKYDVQSRCCPGYEGPIENCMRSSTTPKDIISSISVSPLAITSRSVSVTESSTGMEFTEKLTETSSDKTEASEQSTSPKSDYTEAVTDLTTDFFGTSSTEMSIVSEVIATKVNWWSLPIWFFCILVIVAFLAMCVKILVHRNSRRAYVVNEKVTSTESHC